MTQGEIDLDNIKSDKKDPNNKDTKIDEKIEIAFEKIKNHPFLISNPIQSKNVALFRIKLLGLA